MPVKASAFGAAAASTDEEKPKTSGRGRASGRAAGGRASGRAASKPSTNGRKRGAAAAKPAAEKPAKVDGRSKAARAAKGTGAGAKKASSNGGSGKGYVILSKDGDDAYTFVGRHDGINPEKAVDAYLDANPDVEEGVFIAVAERQFKEQPVKYEPVPPKRVRG